MIDDTIIFAKQINNNNFYSFRKIRRNVFVVASATVNSTKGPDKRTIEEAEGLSNAVVVIMFEPKR